MEILRLPGKVTVFATHKMDASSDLKAIWFFVTNLVIPLIGTFSDDNLTSSAHVKQHTWFNHLALDLLWA